MCEILHYFPQLSQNQRDKFLLLEELLKYWNSKINVVSRKDMEHFFIRHLLHSLSIAKVFSFAPDTSIIDIGTGGGLPGIPLAIFFPECQFTLIDSIGKKMKVVQDVASQLELENVHCKTGRAEELKQQFDFITARAVSNLPSFLTLVHGKINKKHNNSFHNGIIYLKGGDIEEEIGETRKKYTVFHIKDYFKEEFFETKKIVYIESV